MYICERCGWEYEELPSGAEPRPYGESYVLENMVYHTCDCGGELVPAAICEICENVFAEDELTAGVCHDCMNEGATADNAVKFAESMEERDTAEINPVWAYMFAGEIDSILEDEFKRRADNEMIACKLKDVFWDFTKGDECFAEFLKEEAS